MPVVSFRRSLLSLCVLAALSAGAAVPAWGQDPPRERGDRGNRAERMPEPQHDHEPPRSRSDRQRSQDALADSVRRFERSRGDRVLSAERMQTADDRDVNRIKAMDERGRVRVYVDDPQQRQQQRPQQPPPRTRDDND